MFILTIFSNIINKKPILLVEKKLNLFSEFLLKKYNSEETIIEVCDCQNFVVIKGFSNDKEVVSIQSVSEEFSEKYQDFPIQRTIDLIEYKKDLSPPKEFSFFYGREFCNTPKLFATSKFPFGYSKNQGKLLYFYFKHIVDRIPPSYPFSWIKFDVRISDKREIDFTIEDDYLNDFDGSLKSAILDSFDFNLVEFETVLNGIDLEKYILNPSEENLLNDISVKDFLII